MSDNATSQGLGCLTRNDLALRAYSRLRVFGSGSFTTRKVARFPERSFMNKRLGFVFVALMAVPVALLGQEKPPASSAPAAQSAPPANPITASEKGFYSFVSSAVVGAAQKMPEENYSLKPTPEVRTFGQHFLRSEEHTSELQSRQYLVCRLLLEKKNRVYTIEYAQLTRH